MRHRLYLNHDTWSYTYLEFALRPSEVLEAHRASIRALASRYRVENVRVFGSVLHADDIESSDLDLLVEPTPHTTLMDIAGLQVEIETLLGVRVDVLTPKALPIAFRNRVLSEAVPL
jgi:predicted nucleotidyltransferase